MPDSSRPLTCAQSRAIDRYAIEELGYPGIVLMENAGRGCVDVMEQVGIAGPVLVIAGRGNNAGDGFVIARHLALRGHECRVALAAAPSRLSGDARLAFDMLVPCRTPLLDLSGVHASVMIEELDGYANWLSADGPPWIVDALVGTGAAGAPRPPFDSLIDWVNAEQATKLAVDLPSGLDGDTGQPSPPTLRADHTCTFVAPKVGFTEPTAAEYLGQIHVVDIGLPASVVDRV